MNLKIPDGPMQQALFARDKSIAERFEDWKRTAGGAEVMRIAYAKTAPYAERFRRTGRTVSVKLIWELLRDEMAFLRAERRTGCTTTEDGFALNNSFTASLARHMVAHRPEWCGLFEMRDTNDQDMSDRSANNQ